MTRNQGRTREASGMLMNTTMAAALMTLTLALAAAKRARRTIPGHALILALGLLVDKTPGNGGAAAIWNSLSDAMHTRSLRLYQRIKRAKNHQKAVVAVARQPANRTEGSLTKAIFIVNSRAVRRLKACPTLFHCNNRYSA